jgi:hypothetical protein
MMPLLNGAWIVLGMWFYIDASLNGLYSLCALVVEAFAFKALQRDSKRFKAIQRSRRKNYNQAAPDSGCSNLL